ncbi:MAG: metal ABC transporter permease [Gammaproteobacteria bacterium]|nr:metal ABC transporter permease [Gammaproteobacteria bacterium]
MSLYDLLFAPFAEFAFMRRALSGCVALSLGAAPVGVFLMLRRMSLTGDAMAHAILPGAAVGFLVAGLSLPAMTVGGLIAGLVVAFLSGAVARSTLLREDASLAAFYIISLALGVLIISVQGSSVDLMHVLFGAVLALDDSALYLTGSICTATLLTLALIYRPLVMECVDPNYLRTVTGAGLWVHMLFLALVVSNLVGGFQALGTLMAVGILVLPAAGARFWVREISALLAVAALLGILASYIGLLSSYHLNWPSGPAIVLCAGVIYLVSLLAGPVGSYLVQFWPARHLEA